MTEVYQHVLGVVLGLSLAWFLHRWGTTLLAVAGVVAIGAVVLALTVLEVAARTLWLLWHAPLVLVRLVWVRWTGGLR